MTAGYQEWMISSRAAIGWGVFTLVFSSMVGRIAPTVIEAINKIGSLFYGPILGIFLLAVLAPRTGGRDAILGLLAGLAVNLVLWLFFPQVFWFWWNAIGCVVTLAVALVSARLYPRRPVAAAPSSGVVWQELASPAGLALCAAFLVLLAIGALFGHLKG